MKILLLDGSCLHIESIVFTGYTYYQYHGFHYVLNKNAEMLKDDMKQFNLIDTKQFTSEIKKNVDKRTQKDVYLKGLEDKYESLHKFSNCILKETVQQNENNQHETMKIIDFEHSYNICKRITFNDAPYDDKEKNKSL